MTLTKPFGEVNDRHSTTCNKQNCILCVYLTRTCPVVSGKTCPAVQFRTSPADLLHNNIDETQRLLCEGSCQTALSSAVYSSTLTLMMSWCLMSSDVIWHIRDKLWPMPKHGSIKSTYVRCMRVLAVTCHLHFWQNDRDFLRATVVTRGWNGYRNKSQHRKSTPEKKILPPFQQGFEPATFQSRVRCSNHWAIPAPH